VAGKPCPRIVDDLLNFIALFGEAIQLRLPISRGRR
jgi:hypothetical protein